MIILYVRRYSLYRIEEKSWSSHSQLQNRLQYIRCIGEIEDFSSSSESSDNIVKLLLYNLCNPFKHDLRYASLCGVEFVLQGKEGVKKVMFERVTEIVPLSEFGQQILYLSMGLA